MYYSWGHSKMTFGGWGGQTGETVHLKTFLKEKKQHIVLQLQLVLTKNNFMVDGRLSQT